MMNFNPTALARAYVVAEENSNLWRQGTWGMAGYEQVNQCNTTACMAGILVSNEGWSLAFEPYQFTTVKGKEVLNPGATTETCMRPIPGTERYETHGIQDLAEKIAGLDSREAEQLFVDTAFSEDYNEEEALIGQEHEAVLVALKDLFRRNHKKWSYHYKKAQAWYAKEKKSWPVTVEMDPDY